MLISYFLMKPMARVAFERVVICHFHAHAILALAGTNQSCGDNLDSIRTWVRRDGKEPVHITMKVEPGGRHVLVAGVTFG